jgi:hypothetical protein
MKTRILHCSTSVENYNICVNHKIAGFSNRGPQPGDLIYLAVKVGKRTVCGVRFTLDSPTDSRPWPNGEKYNHALRISNIEYCQPFDISVLSKTGEQFWGIKFMQGSKPIIDTRACELLNLEFEKSKTTSFVPQVVVTVKNIPKTQFLQPSLPGIPTDEFPLTRESIKIQAMLAEIGERMGYKIWIPKSDRSRILEVWESKLSSLIDELPLNYDIDTIKTIENIDVLWIRGRTIVRAFEIEHTTSIYSGILRMADLMALQPNINIKAHIVAPNERKGKVMQELSRPVFRYVLAQTCSFISYHSIEELAEERRLEYMTDAVLEDIAEFSETFSV